MEKVVAPRNQRNAAPGTGGEPDLRYKLSTEQPGSAHNTVRVGLREGWIDGSYLEGDEVGCCGPSLAKGRARDAHRCPLREGRSV